MAHYTIITSKTCVWCDKVKDLIDSEGHTYTEIDVAPMKEFLFSNGLTTVPQVFINGLLVGGYHDTKEAFNV